MCIRDRREYDAFGRVITDRDGNGQSVKHEYDRLGLEVLTSDGIGDKKTAYDAFGNVLWLSLILI